MDREEVVTDRDWTSVAAIIIICIFLAYLFLTRNK